MVMIEKLALQLTSFLCTEDYNTAKDKAKIQYGLSILLSEGIKVIFLILFFHIIHHQNYFYFSLFILITIRIFAGGIHVKGTASCLLLTIFLFTLTSVLAPLIPKLPMVFYLFVCVSSVAILLIKAPLCSEQRPIKDNKKKLQYKITAILMTVIWSMVLLYSSNIAYVSCGLSTIFLQNMQLIFDKGWGLKKVINFII